jgi:2-alkyl-3-oxoalkanoate reductase
MGDLAWQDSKSRIWFCGRKGHRVITPHGTLFTIPCEAIFNNHPAVFRSALVGIGHTAAKPPPWGRLADYRKTNVSGTENVIAACRTQGVKRLIHTSSPSVVFDGRDLEGVDESAPYPDRWHSHYSATKAEAEQRVVAAAATGLCALVLRPHQVWGPEDPHFVPRILSRAQRLKRIGDGKNLVDTTYIDNAAEAHLLAADCLRETSDRSGRIYFISQGEPVPAWEMIDAILAAAGKGPVKGRIPHRTAHRMGWLCEILFRALRLPGEPPMTRFVADALARAHWFDINAARRDLGYAPQVSTAEGLRRLAKWLQTEAGGSPHMRG